MDIGYIIHISQQKTTIPNEQELAGFFKSSQTIPSTRAKGWYSCYGPCHYSHPGPAMFKDIQRQFEDWKMGELASENPLDFSPQRTDPDIPKTHT